MRGGNERRRWLTQEEVEYIRHASLACYGIACISSTSYRFYFTMLFSNVVAAGALLVAQASAHGAVTSYVIDGVTYPGYVTLSISYELALQYFLVRSCLELHGFPFYIAAKSSRLHPITLTTVAHKRPSDTKASRPPPPQRQSNANGPTTTRP